MSVNACSRRTFSKGLAGAAVVAFGGGLVMAGCSTGAEGGSGGAAGDRAGYKVGVLQLTEHAALDAANGGFVAALEDSGIAVSIDQQNAQNDQSACQTIASKFVNDGCDLILAIGTPAAQAVAGATTEIPIVCTAITDFVAAGLVESDEEPGGNVTGTSDMNPVAEQIELLHRLVPEARTVGLLYCTAESNSKIQIDAASDKLDDLGLQGVPFTISSSNEVQQVVESMVGKVDAIYTPTDNTVASAMATVAMVANENKIPTMCGEAAHVEAGGLASISINYGELGRLAGEIAVKILEEGVDPAQIPVQRMGSDECDLVFNGETAALVGVDVGILIDEGGVDVTA